MNRFQEPNCTTKWHSNRRRLSIIFRLLSLSSFLLHTEDFTKKDREMSSQLFVTQYMYTIYRSLCTQRAEMKSPEPFSWIPQYKILINEWMTEYPTDMHIINYSTMCAAKRVRISCLWHYIHYVYYIIIYDINRY